ncbi:hypothetical protein JCM1840_000972 [Sporobolomyces johnsonii]
MSWSAVLEAYARKPHPERDLPEGVWLCNDERTLTIFDGYEKAKFHFLVMPRDPFPLEKGGTVPSSSLHSLSSLLKSPHKLEVLKALERQAAEVKEMIEDEMMKREGWTWDVRIGFHANESMRHVHLHVISSDMLSPKLKNKKHWNSFHPELGFFLHLSDVIAGVEDGSFSLQPKDDYESILKLPLQSFYDGRTYANLPKLKDHLLDEFKKRGKAEKARIEAAKENEDANENEKGTKREADTQEGATQLQNDGESPLKKPKVDA